MRYLYDDLGRLKQVIDQNGDVATYNYDAVGNILSIQRGPGSCSVGPPVLTTVSADRCFQGTACAVSINGTGLLGAGVTTSEPLATITDCRTDCQAITCLFSADPSLAPGQVDFAVTTTFGSTQGTIDVLPAPVLDRPGEIAFWHFAANAGDSVTIRMTRIASLPNGSASLDPTLGLLDSRGFLIFADDDSGSNQPPGPGRNAVLTLALPATDTYSVAAFGRNGTSGPYVLSIMPPTVLLKPELVVMTTEQPREQTFSGAIAHSTERDPLTFAASVGESVSISVRRVGNQPDGTGTLDPVVELRDSRDVLIAFNRDAGTNEPNGPGRNALIPDLRLPATDAYRVLVGGENGTTGPYEVLISVKPAS